MSLPATDNFNRADGALGANWTTVPGKSAIAISGNTAAASAVDPSMCAAYWNADTFSADQYAQVTRIFGAQGDDNWPIVRASISAATFYRVDTSNYITKSVNGVESYVGAVFSGFAASTTSGDVIRLAVVGNVLTLYKNGVSQGSRTDSSSPITSGAPGMFLWVGSTTTNYLDNWEGGDMGGGTTYNQSVAGTFPSPSGVIAKMVVKGLAGTMPAASGVITRRAAKMLTGVMPQAAGTAAKRTGKVLAGVFPSAFSTVSNPGMFSQGVSGTMPNPTGGIVKLVGKSVTGAFPAGSGGPVMRTAKVVAGTMPAASGTLAESVTLHATLSGIMGAISGAVSTVLNPVVVAAKGLLKIIGSGFKKIIGG